MDTHFFIRPKLFASCRKVFVLLALCAFLNACSTVQVSQDYVPDYSFSPAATFNWNETLQHKNDEQYQHDDLQANRFKRAIEENLARRGFTRDTQPDLLVSYTYTVSTKLQTDNLHSHFGFGYGYYNRYNRFGVDTGSSIHQYDQGKLEILIHSAKTGELLWKGTGTREISTHKTPEEITSRVNEMVEAVLAQFPPAMQ
jgi:hypothetical protein